MAKEFQLEFGSWEIVRKEEVIQASWFLESKMRIVNRGNIFLRRLKYI